MCAPNRMFTCNDANLWYRLRAEALRDDITAYIIHTMYTSSAPQYINFSKVLHLRTVMSGGVYPKFEILPPSRPSLKKTAARGSDLSDFVRNLTKPRPRQAKTGQGFILLPDEGPWPVLQE